MFKKKKKRKQKKENVRIETCDDNRDIKLSTWSIGKNLAKQEEKETHWSRGSLRIGWIDSRALVGTIDDVLIVSRWPTIDATADVPSHRVYRGRTSGKTKVVGATNGTRRRKERRRSRILYGFGDNSRTRVVERLYLHPSRISIIERYPMEQANWRGIMTSCQERSAAWSPVNYMLFWPVGVFRGERLAIRLFVEQKKREKERKEKKGKKKVEKTRIDLRFWP